MIVISKTPLRISLGGGGTDIDKFYTQYKHGMWISGAIDQFIYVIVKSRFEKKMRLAYSEIEEVFYPSQIKHPIIREVFKELLVNGHTEVSVMSELPSRVGLGSSGAFTVGLINAISNFNGLPSDAITLAKKAYRVEHDILQRPIGWQDSYIAALGGLRTFYVDDKGNVTHTEFRAVEASRLENSLSLFFTGTRRTAADILEWQQKNVSYIDLMSKIYDIGKQSVRAIQIRDTGAYGKLMHEHWLVKKNTTDNMSNDEIDSMYEWALENGAFGGKVVGAGGGGYLMFCSQNKKEFDVAFARKFGIEPLAWKFWWRGSEVIKI